MVVVGKSAAVTLDSQRYSGGPAIRGTRGKRRDRVNRERP